MVLRERASTRSGQVQTAMEELSTDQTPYSHAAVNQKTTTSKTPFVVTFFKAPASADGWRNGGAVGAGGMRASFSALTTTAERSSLDWDMKRTVMMECNTDPRWGEAGPLCKFAVAGVFNLSADDG